MNLFKFNRRLLILGLIFIMIGIIIAGIAGLTTGFNFSQLLHHDWTWYAPYNMSVN